MTPTPDPTPRRTLRLLTTEDEKDTAPHWMAEMDASGDTTYAWNPADAEDLIAARLHFDLMRGKGYAAYRQDASGARGEVIRTFDPEARRIVYLKPLQGG